MFVVVDRPRFVKMLDLARDDKKSPTKRKVEEIPYLRIAATVDSTLTLSGLSVEASFPATVHEPGVLFIRAAKFSQLISMLKGQKLLAIQASASGVDFADMHLPMNRADFLLYPEPEIAPMHHPGDRQRAGEATAAGLTRFASESRRRRSGSSCPLKPWRTRKKNSRVFWEPDPTHARR